MVNKYMHKGYREIYEDTHKVGLTTLTLVTGEDMNSVNEFVDHYMIRIIKGTLKTCTYINLDTKVHKYEELKILTKDDAGVLDNVTIIENIRDLENICKSIRRSLNNVIINYSKLITITNNPFEDDFTKLAYILRKLSNTIEGFPVNIILICDSLDERLYDLTDNVITVSSDSTTDTNYPVALPILKVKPIKNLNGDNNTYCFFYDRKTGIYE